MKPFIAHIGVAVLVSAFGSSSQAWQATKLDVLEQPDGKSLGGKFFGDLKTGFYFKAIDASRSVLMEDPAEIQLGGDGPGPTTGVPPVKVVLGLGQLLSGQLSSLDAENITLVEGPSGRGVKIARHGALGLRQRPGEALVLIDGFETIDTTRWSSTGLPKLADDIHFAGAHSLNLPANGAAITHKLAEPVAQGRFEVAVYDIPATVPGAQWFVELLFRGERGPESVRAVLGWSEDSLAVQTTGTISLAVQRLARKPGWHRLEVRFGTDTTEMSLDGNALAHGKAPTGPLVELRIGTILNGKLAEPGLAAHIDELRLVRLASAVSSPEVDPNQDELRLVEGDQIFGAIESADAQKVVVDVIGKKVSLPWSDVSSLYFKRVARPSRPVDGLLVKLQWRCGPGNDPRDVDVVEGALVSADDSSFRLETPYAGQIVIPRDRLRKLTVFGRGTRLVIDPTAHHMGDDPSKPPDMLDPPQPEGGVLERKFTLAAVPDKTSQAAIVIDAIQVVGEANGLPFSQLVRLGELRTKAYLNGKEFDYLNRHITTINDVPERISLPIPAGLLKAGENTFKLVQTGTANNPNYFDDLGILGITLDITATKPVP